MFDTAVVATLVAVVADATAPFTTAPGTCPEEFTIVVALTTNPPAVIIPVLPTVNCVVAPLLAVRRSPSP